MYAGKYYAIMAGDPGLFGGLAKLAKGAVGLVTKTPLGRVASKFVPGLNIATTALSLGGLAAKVSRGVVGRVMPGIGKVVYPGRMGAVAGAAAGGGKLGKLALAGGGALGGAALTYPGRMGSALNPPMSAAEAKRMGVSSGRRYRRMNPLNPKAARRAIRRIKAVRKLVRSIESQLPKRASRDATFHRRRRKAA